MGHLLATSASGITPVTRPRPQAACVGDGFHQADVGTAVHEFDAARGQFVAEVAAAARYSRR
jgi:hypothetical protein